MDTDTWIIVAVVVAAVVVIGLIVAMAVKAKRRKELQSRFGPEYDRTIEREGNKRRAEKDLQQRAAERERLRLRNLTPAEQDRYREQWQAVQASFVDRPESSLADADRLVTSLMRDRGYPVDDFDHQADLISVDHPQVVTHYRAAHDIWERSRHSDVTTEDQRRAVVHYRALFDELMVPSGDGDGDIDLRDRDEERERLDEARLRDDMGSTKAGPLGEVRGRR
jgi:hypothetical protein